MRIFLSFLAFSCYAYNAVEARRCENCSRNYTITTHFPESYYSHINSPHFLTDVTNGSSYESNSSYDSDDSSNDLTELFGGNYRWNDDLLDTPLDWFNIEGMNANMLELELGEDDIDELNEDIFVGGQIFFRPHPRMWLIKTINAFNHEHFNQSLCFIDRYEKALIARGLIPYFPGKITRRQRAIIHFYRNASKEMINYGYLDSSETIPFESYTDLTYDCNDFDSYTSYNSNYDITNLLLKAYVIQAKNHYKNGNVKKCKKMVTHLIKHFNNSVEEDKNSDNAYVQAINSDDISKEEKEEVLFNLVTAEP